jgi:hypothetical protein
MEEAPIARGFSLLGGWQVQQMTTCGVALPPVVVLLGVPFLPWIAQPPPPPPPPLDRTVNVIADDADVSDPLVGLSVTVQLSATESLTGNAPLAIGPAEQVDVEPVTVYPPV